MAENAEMQRVAREGALLAGGARAILLQIAHPAVGRGVAEHSDFAARPLDRLRTTLTYVYSVTFGTSDEVEAVAAAVTAAHRKVTGAGYRATDPELQLWVAATLYDTALLVYEELFGPLDAAVADRVYSQYAVLGTALQVPAERWPADRAAFDAYWQQMVDTLEVSDDARRVAADLLAARHAPLLLKAAMPANRFLTTAWLPERIRRQYGLPWGTGQQRLYDGVMKAAAPFYRLLPAPVREAPKTYYLRDMRKRLAT
ncbi:MAG TPA: oxygenase MpaB family protein [Acidimicrobiia bacterium]|nr:oxygenase MpaB family protein [Acidimicrobiia bacterium]